MSKHPNYFRIGLFVIACLILVVGGILAISADSFKGTVVYLETYLNESVMGLNVGSALTHRGVNIGRVEDITFVASEYPKEVTGDDLDKFGRYVMIVVAVDLNKVGSVSKSAEDFREMMKRQIEQGLRLKLSYQGITGMAVLETDYIDVTKPNHEDLQINWTPKYLYVPSTPSIFTSVTTAFEKVFERLEKINFEGVVADVKMTLQSINKAVVDAEVGKLSMTARDMVADLKVTNKKLQSLMDKFDGLAGQEVPQALKDLSVTLTRVEMLIGRHEPDVDQLMIDLQTAVRNLNQLIESVKADPATLFFSVPPETPEVIQ